MGDADSTFSASADPCWSAEDTAHAGADRSEIFMLVVQLWVLPAKVQSVESCKMPIQKKVNFSTSNNTVS